MSNGNQFSIKHKVSSLSENLQVIWEHSRSKPEAWMGTEIVFDIEPSDGQCFLCSV